MTEALGAPYNAILGVSDLLLDDSTGTYTAATRQKFLAQISTGGKHLLDLINDILDLSKVEAGQMFLELETVSIAETVDQVMNTIEPIAAKKGVRVEANVGAAGRLQADPHKMVQMLLNLVTNAVKLTPEGVSLPLFAQRQADTGEISPRATGIAVPR